MQSLDGSANAPIEADEVNKVAARLGLILTFRILTRKQLMAKNHIAELEIETLKSSPPRTEQEFKKFKEGVRARMVARRAWETDEKRAGQVLRNVVHEIMVLMSKESLVKPSTLLTWVRNYEKSNQEALRDC